jgi:la-related protein 4
VEYYFSRENLCQDTFLVSKMDSQHYVDVAIIADFKMVKQLTSDTDLILSCVTGSDKVRFQCKLYICMSVS